MGAERDLSRTAVLVLAFGGPRSLDEVDWFLERLLGEKPSIPRIEGLKRRYQSIGGASPLPGITLRQAKALDESLRERGLTLRIYPGMRHGHPLIAEALEEIRKEKVSRIVLLSLSPYRSPFTSEGYYEEAKRVVGSWTQGVDLIKIDDWYAHPALCAAWAKQIVDSLEQIPERGEELPVIFTAHSLPQDAAAGAPWYAEQLETTAKGIARIIGLTRWQLAFQSQTRGGEWLGPQPQFVLQELLQQGYHKTLIVPLGFISEHLETLYDLDISLRDWAASQGITIIRVPCLNDSPDLIETLAQLVEGALRRR